MRTSAAGRAPAATSPRAARARASVRTNEESRVGPPTWLLPSAHAAVDQQHVAVDVFRLIADEVHRARAAHVGARDLPVGRVMRDPSRLLGPRVDPACL